MSYLIAASCNLCARDVGKIIFLCSILCHLHREIQIHHYTILIKRFITNTTMILCLIILFICISGQILHHCSLMRSMLDMLRHSHYVKTIKPSLLYTEFWQDLAIRKDSMCMQVRLVYIVTIHLRKKQFLSDIAFFK